MQSAQHLLERWSELRTVWEDDVAKRFESEFIQQILTNAKEVDELKEGFILMHERQPP